MRQRNQAAVAAAKNKLERRKEARHLVATNPALARDLKIGRPDLPREYDDGGLVDVNHVPVGVFSSGLGLTPIEARDVLAARDKLGRFVSAEGNMRVHPALPRPRGRAPRPDDLHLSGWVHDRGQFQADSTGFWP
jgi:hypothetical protein